MTTRLDLLKRLGWRDPTELMYAAIQRNNAGKVRAWLDRLAELPHLSSWWRASTPMYKKWDAFGAQLTLGAVRAGTAQELEELLGVLESYKRNQHRLLGHRAVWSREDFGLLLSETRNRLGYLALGRTHPRVKGPRMDPSRLPDDALDRLIQTHRDMEVVERLREERNKRMVAA